MAEVRHFSLNTTVKTMEKFAHDYVISDIKEKVENKTVAIISNSTH